MVSGLGVGLALLAAVCLAGQALTIRLASRAGATKDVLLIVLAVNTAVFVPLAVVFGGDHGLTRTSVAAFVAAGLVSTMIGRAFFYGGIKRVGAARAEPLKASMPLHATVLAVLLLAEPVSGLQFLGVVLIVVGVAVVSWDGATRDASATGEVDWVGIAFPLIGAFLFALEPILATVGLGEGTPVLVGLAVKTAAAFLVFLAYLTVRDDLPSADQLRRAGDFRWYIVAGVASSAFLLAYYAALDVSRVAVVVPIMQTSPLIVAAGAALFLRGLERVTPALVVGSTVVVVGATLVTVFG